MYIAKYQLTWILWGTGMKIIKEQNVRNNLKRLKRIGKDASKRYIEQYASGGNP